MATRFSNTLQGTNGTNALFEAWCQFIDNTLVTTGGWVNTADTGQLNLATAVAPGAASTKVGYRIYRMNDALQATTPVFMRIDYGSGNSGATTPGFWVTIGSGSDGAGNITGVAFNGGAAASSTVRSNTTVAASACDSYGSADTNRVSLMLFVRPTANDLMLFTLERTKDSSGNDTAAGLLMNYTSTANNGVDGSNYIVLGGGAQPPTQTGVNLAMSNLASSAFSSNVGIGLALHCKSEIVQPGMGMIAVNDGDFIAEATVTVSIYGNTRSYQLGNFNASQVRVPTGNAGASNRANTRVGIRYD